MSIVAEKGNSNAITDAGSAAALARAALTGAGMNVRINLTGLEDPDSAAKMHSRLEDLPAAGRWSACSHPGSIVTTRGKISRISL